MKIYIYMSDGILAIPEVVKERICRIITRNYTVVLNGLHKSTGIVKNYLLSMYYYNTIIYSIEGMLEYSNGEWVTEEIKCYSKDDIKQQIITDADYGFAVFSLLGNSILLDISNMVASGKRVLVYSVHTHGFTVVSSQEDIIKMLADSINHLNGSSMNNYMRRQDNEYY